MYRGVAALGLSLAVNFSSLMACMAVELETVPNSVPNVMLLRCHLPGATGAAAA